MYSLPFLYTSSSLVFSSIVPPLLRPMERSMSIVCPGLACQQLLVTSACEYCLRLGLK